MRKAVVRTQDFLRQLDRIKCDVTINELVSIFGSEISFLSCNEKLRAGAIGKTKMTQLNRIEKICFSEIEYLARNLGSIESLPSSITQYRRVLKAHNDNHPVLWYFKLPRKEYKQRNTNYAKQIDSQNRNLKQFPQSNIKPYVARLTKMVKSDDYVEVAIGLCGLTGRRPGEILVSGIFSKSTQHKYKQSLIFSGQLKTKVKTKDDERKPFEIPVLCGPQIAINALKKLRNMSELLSDIESCKKKGKEKTFAQHLNSLFSKKANSLVTDRLSQFFPDNKVEVYDLRRLYASIAQKLYHDESVTTSSTFLSEILGHVEGKEGKLDITFKSYEKFSITND